MFEATYRRGCGWYPCLANVCTHRSSWYAGEMSLYICERLIQRWLDVCSTFLFFQRVGEVVHSGNGIKMWYKSQVYNCKWEKSAAELDRCKKLNFIQQESWLPHHQEEKRSVERSHYPFQCCWLWTTKKPATVEESLGECKRKVSILEFIKVILVVTHFPYT